MASKQRNLRKRRALDEEEDEGQREGEQAEVPSVEDTKLLQKQRQRKTGIEASALAVADKGPQLGDAAAGGPAGGTDVLEAAFKKEKRRVAEEDPQMKKYIEEQLARRLGRPADADAAQPSGAGGQTADELAESLRARQVDTELAPTWVSGIMEVPLGLEHKLRNIEETEAAKKRMLERSGARVVLEGDDEEEDKGPALRRGQYPVHFGRQRAGEAERIQASMAKKQRMREIQREKKLKKQQEFQGW